MNESKRKRNEEKRSNEPKRVRLFSFPPAPLLPMSSILHNPISAHYYIASSFSHPFEQWDVIGQRLFLFSLVRLNQGLACHQEKKEMNDPWKVVTIVGSREFRVWCHPPTDVYTYISPDVVCVQVECAQRHTSGPPSADTHGINLTPLFRTSM
jgi:hypothetical protein